MFANLPKWNITSIEDALSCPGPTELGYRGRRPLKPGHRLGCQATVTGDIVIDVPAESQVHRPVVRKTIDLGSVVIDPVVTLHYIELPEAELGAEVATAELVKAALRDDWGLTEVTIPISLLPQLQPAVTTGAGTLTVAVHDGSQVIGVRSGYSDGAYGIAVDVGSTTIAGHLCDLASGTVVATTGLMNPQIRFGEDLMSRISYVMMNPGGDAELTAAVRAAIDELVGQLCISASVERDHVHDLVIVGNPIMHHLVLGIDPTPLGTAPFTLAVSDGVHGTAADVGVGLDNCRLHGGPCIAGHVGADAAAAILATGPHRSATPKLLVDVGTNAEIVLGDRNRLLAASSPTGPAFEGGQISCGQRAMAGAIERVRIDADTFEPRFKVIGCETWSDDPGFFEALGGIEISGLCGSGIIEVLAQMFLAGIIDRHGVIGSHMTQRTPRVVPDPEVGGRTFRYVLQSEPIELSITQNDVRAVQLAKAALRAGIDLLMNHADISELEDISLAGAFGSHIDPVYAMVLGLIPDCPLTGVRATGNSAGAGAARMLLSRQQRTEIEQVVRSVVKIETATEDRFQELFVAALAFPHETAPNPHLATMVKLPARISPSSSTQRTRRRRRSSEVPQPGLFV